MKYLFLISMLCLNCFAIVKGKSYEHVSESAKKATVKIEIKNKDNKTTSVGSGFLISKNGYIVTNSHVIWPIVLQKLNSTIHISNYKNEIFKRINIIKCEDPKHLDICILKLEDFEGDNYFQINNRYKIGKGNPIEHVGHCNSAYSVKKGKIENIVSKLKDHYTTSNGDFSAYIFNAQYAACPGDSGAAVYHIEGLSRKKARLLGVLTGGKTQTKWSETEKKMITNYKYKYAIHINEVDKLIQKLVQAKLIDFTKTKQNKAKILKNAKKTRNLADYLSNQ